MRLMALFFFGPPRDGCKISSCLMANAQSMLRAQAGAAANENLDATVARAGEAWGVGGWVPGSGSSWFVSGAF